MIEGCRKRDSRQQELLYRTYASRMLGVCIRYAANKNEAEDILQLGFIKVFDKIHTYKYEGSFEGWLRRIMVNTGIECFRRRQRTLALADWEDNDIAAPLHIADTRLEVKDLLKIIQKLPANYQAVFTLYAIEGYSHKEIATMLEISELASRASLCRAREILKRAVIKWNEPAGAVMAS